MKMNILSCVLVNCILMLSSAFCSDVFITQSGTSINKSAISYCMDKSIGAFWIENSILKLSNLPNNYNKLVSFPRHIKTTDFKSVPNELSRWYFSIGLCKSFLILHETICTLHDEISYEELPNECKKLLSRNIKELKNKCNVQVAQKLSLLTSIDVSWEDTLSSMKTITEGKALSHRYTLTEALFILHLKPSKPLINYLNPINYLKRNNYENKDVLFYAECITGALACVLKHDKKIPTDFEFDLIQTSDSSWRFMKNVKKLMLAYKNNFIKEQNEMNIINNKSKKENNKNTAYNLLQDEEKIKLKQD